MALIGYIGCDLVINRWQLGTTPTCYKPANSRLIAGCYNNTDTLNSKFLPSDGYKPANNHFWY